MAGIFSRLFKIGQSEVHAVVDQLEDPIKMTEQGIRDLKKDLAEAMQSLAQIKGLAIRLKKESDDALKLSQDYERKAMLLIQRAQNGEIDAQKAEQLAMEVLNEKQSFEKRALQLQTEYQAQNGMSQQLQHKVDELRKTISTYENELVTLRARAKTASSMKKINQQLSRIDSSSTIAMLEKMKQKVSEEESLATAYGDIAAQNASIEVRVNEALASPSMDSKRSLEDLKRKMGLLPSPTGS
ncbi:MAG: PspA/IM30 family protein [Deltaproteobacteria bacterium]|jgi:phage shock protein A|nr:PspA/IM30 family protein [Deltaproteobacteria bacterium]